MGNFSFEPSTDGSPASSTSTFDRNIADCADDGGFSVLDANSSVVDGETYIRTKKINLIPSGGTAPYSYSKPAYGNFSDTATNGVYFTTGADPNGLLIQTFQMAVFDANNDCVLVDFNVHRTGKAVAAFGTGGIKLSFVAGSDNQLWKSLVYNETDNIIFGVGFGGSGSALFSRSTKAIVSVFDADNGTNKAGELSYNYGSEMDASHVSYLGNNLYLMVGNMHESVEGTGIFPYAVLSQWVNNSSTLSAGINFSGNALKLTNFKVTNPSAVSQPGALSAVAQNGTDFVMAIKQSSGTSFQKFSIASGAAEATFNGVSFGLNFTTGTVPTIHLGINETLFGFGIESGPNLTRFLRASDGSSSSTDTSAVGVGGTPEIVDSVVLSDGRYVVIGTADREVGSADNDAIYVALLSSTGTILSEYLGPTGTHDENLSTEEEQATAVAVGPSNEVYVAGYYFDNPDTKGFVARFFTDSDQLTLDTNFGQHSDGSGGFKNSGFHIIDLSGATPRKTKVYDILLDSAGRLLVGGGAVPATKTDFDAFLYKFSP